eukprot:3132054-Amphidinium_carterae.1
MIFSNAPPCIIPPCGFSRQFGCDLHNSSEALLTSRRMGSVVFGHLVIKQCVQGRGSALAHSRCF